MSNTENNVSAELIVKVREDEFHAPDLAEHNLRNAKIGDKVNITVGHLFVDAGPGVLVQAEAVFGGKPGDAFDVDGQFAVLAENGLSALIGAPAVIGAGDFEIVKEG